MYIHKCIGKLRSLFSFFFSSNEIEGEITFYFKLQIVALIKLEKLYSCSKITNR